MAISSAFYSPSILLISFWHIMYYVAYYIYARSDSLPFVRKLLDSWLVIRELSHTAFYVFTFGPSQSSHRYIWPRCAHDVTSMWMDDSAHNAVMVKQISKGEFFLHSKQKRELRANIVQRVWFGMDNPAKKIQSWRGLQRTVYRRNPQNTMGTNTFWTISSQCKLCLTFRQTALALAKSILNHLRSCSTSGASVNFWSAWGQSLGNSYISLCQCVRTCTHADLSTLNNRKSRRHHQLWPA